MEAQGDGGAGWVEHVDQDGRCSVTADPQGARQFATLEDAEAARRRLRPGLVQFAPVEGRSFDRRTCGAPD